MIEIRVDLGDRGYAVRVEAGAVARGFADLLAVLPPGPVAILSDSTVAPLYGEAARRSVEASGRKAFAVTVPAGEGSKSLEVFSRVQGELLSGGADRTSSLLALGGGVVGDLGGFVASTFMRGIPFFMVPTSLLAQVDSSVGGKVAVNHTRSKNLIGLFAQPAGVLADPAVLSTLPAEEYASGLAEAVKTAAILDAALFERMEAGREAVRARDPAALEAVIARCVELKAGIVEKDERETKGLREVLNFGHTVGHALESALGYGTIRHGEAVAIGMVAACRLAERARGFPAEETARLEALLSFLGLPVRLPPGLDPRSLAGIMRGDKKRRGGALRFVLLEKIGRAAPAQDVEEKQVLETLRGFAE
ncbi:MAG: 3-dehydroquinate synthase [Planctomycetes bacterium]|jgi:3-dehydroquinate synthase|nr:3-dehydroquinate synthase [Planctomycetota bacterium]